MKKYLREFVEEEKTKEETYGILQVGSSLYSKLPNDIDIVIITNKLYERKFYITNNTIPVEIEYIGIEAFRSYYQNFYWYPDNLVFEIGKFRNSKLLYDTDSITREVLNKIIKPNNYVRIFIITFIIGEILKIINKNSIYIKQDVIKYITLLFMVVNKEYPAKITYFIDKGSDVYVAVDSMCDDCGKIDNEKLGNYITKYIQNTDKTVYSDIVRMSLDHLPMYYPQNFNGIQFLRNDNNYETCDILFKSR